MKPTIEEACALATGRGGTCLSARFQRSNIPLKWRCKRGHVWKARFHHVRSGSWCKRCAPVVGTLEEMQALAQARGGRFRSPEFHGVAFKYDWQCREGHVWTTQAHLVISGSWCPECATGLGERFCRAYFEKVFGRSFPRSRPDWLVSERSGKR